MSNEKSGERWIVSYRRYSSDQWLTECFSSKRAAEKFKQDYLYDRGSEAQAVIRHYVEVSAEQLK